MYILKFNMYIMKLYLTICIHTSIYISIYIYYSLSLYTLYKHTYIHYTYIHICIYKHISIYICISYIYK